jgi:hypothetical protein
VHRRIGTAALARLLALGLLLEGWLGPAGSGGLVLADARFGLSSRGGAPGSAVVARGDGFPLEAKGRLKWADGTILTTLRTGRRGRFPAELVVPEADSEAYAVTARAGGARWVSFEVAERTTTDPTAPSTAPTYYVDSDNGDDANTGTSEAEAWKTLGKANQTPLAPGDRLLFKRGGRWTGSLKVTKSGTSDSPIVIGSYGTGPLPVIQRGTSCIVLSGSHLVLREIQVDNCWWSGVAVSGSANRVEHSLITRNAAGVHVLAGATDNRILNNELRDNNRMSVLTQSPTDDDSGAFGVLLQGAETEVAYNTISGSDAFSYDYGRDGAAVEVNGKNNSIHHNLALDNDAFTELGNSRSSDNTYAYNVVRSSLDRSVFLITRGAASGYGPVLRTNLFNNTVLLTGSSSQGFVCHDGCGPDVLTMRNNIIQAAGKVGYADAPFDEDYNLFYGGQLQITKGRHSVAADPRFADPAGGNLHLRAASPAVDRGVEVGYRQDFDGAPVPVDGDGDGRATPDLGAFERQR